MNPIAKHQSLTAASPLADAAPAGATGVITVDLATIANNWQALARRVPPARCGAVVKADAYGLGAARVIPALVKAGCSTFFIATPDEARLARSLAPKADIFALDGLAGDGGETFVALGVMPVLSTLDDVARWSVLATSRHANLPAAMHIDTGRSAPMRCPPAAWCRGTNVRTEEMGACGGVADRMDIMQLCGHRIGPLRWHAATRRQATRDRIIGSAP